jgi:membrane glycosyltransferase
MLLLSSSLVVDHTLTGDVYFGATRSLFPIWPQVRWPEIHGLLALTGVLLFGPKILALALRLWSRRNARRFGGRASLIVSFLGEIALTTLLAPVMMLFHTTFVIGILAGNAVGWPAQPRGDRGMPWRVALRRHILHAVLGVAALVTLGLLTPSYLPWILPVVAGLILSVPIAVLTSRRDVGVAARRAGVFVTPEEGRSTKT